MLNILNLPDQVLKGLVISRVNKLHTKRKGDELLVFNPRMGHFSIFNEPFISFFRKLRKPISYKDFIKNEQGMPPAMFIIFLEEAFQNGLIAFSGKAIQLTKQPSESKIKHKTLQLVLTKGGGGPAHFIPIMNRYARMDKHTTFLINISGRIEPNAKNLTVFMENTRCKFEDNGSAANFTIHVDNPADIQYYLESTKKGGMIFSFNLKDDRETHDAEKGSGHYEKILNTAKELQKKGYKTAVNCFFTNPDLIPTTVESLLEEGISNIGVKISHQVILEDSPMSKYLKMMELFGKKTIEAMDLTFERLKWGRERIYLNDIQRMLLNISGTDTFHPCSMRPCGMGTQLLVIHDNRDVFACNPVGPKTEKMLKLDKNIEDLVPSGKAPEILSRRSEPGPRCGRCVWECFCHGGCPALAYEKYGDVTREDPRCRFFQVIFENLVWKIKKEPTLLAKIGGFS